MPFLKKFLAKQMSAGAYLSSFLAQSGFSVAEIAVRAHLSERVVTSLLADNFSVISDPYYVRHLLRHLARSLGADPEFTERLFLEKLPEEKIPRFQPEAIFARRRTSASAFFVSARSVSATIFLLAFLALGSYFGISIRGALAPPVVILSSPMDNQVTKSRIISVAGRTEPEVSIRVNGEVMVLDDVGKFAAPLYLEEGLNIVEVRAARRHSRDAIIYRKVLVEPIVNSSNEGVSLKK